MDRSGDRQAADGMGELTAYRIAGEYRFTEADLEKFLESQRVLVDIRSKTRAVIKQLLVTDRPVTPSDLDQQEAL